MRLALFDIDGTLVATGGAGRRAFERACREVHGIDDALAGVSLGGMTDRRLVELVFRAHRGRAASETEYQALIDGYLPHLADEVAACDSYRVLPGVDAALTACTAVGAAVGLATGNVARAARVKLERGGLAGRFAFGGYGCDAAERAALVEHAIVRGEAHAGRRFDRRHVMVIGDTPLDVAAAHACGAEAVAVATGGVGVDALRATGAEFVLTTLEELPAVLAAA